MPGKPRRRRLLVPAPKGSVLVPEAARLLGVTDETVRTYIRREKPSLKARLTGGRYEVRYDHLRAFAKACLGLDLPKSQEDAA